MITFLSLFLTCYCLKSTSMKTQIRTKNLVKNKKGYDLILLFSKKKARNLLVCQKLLYLESFVFHWISLEALL